MEELYKNCFVYRIAIEDQDESETDNNIEMVKKSNPERYLHHICIKTSDYIEFVRDDTIHRQ